MELSRKTAIVTGGSRGIGKSIARELAREGMDVAIVAWGMDALEATAAERARDTGRRVIPVKTDTGDDDGVWGTGRYNELRNSSSSSSSAVE